MQSDDVFRRAFDVETARLTAWADMQRDAADVSCERTRDYWRVRLLPKVRNACPVELILHRASQTFDIEVGGVTSENQFINEFKHFAAQLQAIVEGHVVTRRRASAATAAALGTEVVIGRDREAVTYRVETDVTTLDAVTRTQHWLPYRR